MRHTRSFLALAALGALAACQDQMTSALPQGPDATSRPAAREGFVVPGEIRTGWILDARGEPVQVKYEVHEGRAIFEGDIDLGPADSIPTAPEPLKRPGGPRYGVIIDGSGNRWPGGAVYYQMSASFNSTQQQVILDALAHISNNNGGVRFYPRTSYSSNYINFALSTSGCSSPVGKRGGSQTINLTSGCAYSLGVVVHEVLHSLGMWHEQSRCDRDSYVEILSGNIQSGQSHNFDKHCTSATDVHPYDEGSVMHYAPYDFGKVVNGSALQTIRSRRGLEYLMGQRSGMSGADVNTVHWMYSPPVNLTVTYPGGVPTLSWNVPPTATGFEVYRVTNEYYNHVYDGSWENEYPELLASTTGTSATDYMTYTGCNTTYDNSDYYAQHEWRYSYKVVAHFPSGGTSVGWATADVATCN